MNPRLDLLAVPSASCAAPNSACCAPYRPDCDTAPELFAAGAVALERGIGATLRFLNRALCCTSYSLR